MVVLNHTSISDQAYEILSEQIINHQLMPGERLPEEQIAKTLGVSRTPLRDAINRLAKDGFVIIEPRKGASVTQFQLEDVIEVYDIRTALEGLAAKLAVPHLDIKHLEKLNKQFKTKSIKTLIEADTALHECIIRNCHNKKLVDILNNLHNLIQVFRVDGYCSIQRSEDATSDHIAILKALIDRNGEQAEQLMRKHIQKTKLEIIRNFKHKNNRNDQEQNK